MINLNIRYDDIYPLLAGVIIGSELFPSLNLSYWEPDYPNNLTIQQINFRKRLYLNTFTNRLIIILGSWSILLYLLYPLSPLVTVLIGLSLLVSFLSRYNFRSMRKYASLAGFHLIAFLLMSFILYQRFEDKLVFLGPVLILVGGSLIGQSRNQPDQENLDLLGRVLFGVGMMMVVISLKSIKTL